MREIKFRVWDKITNTMVDAKTIEFDNNGLNKFTGKNYLTEISYRIRKDDNIHYQNRYKSEFELMQYTGLKDKNNTEIYESDSIRALNRSYDCKDDKENYFQIFTVNYSNGCFMFGNWNAHEFFSRFTLIEITGNIYEISEEV